MIRSYLTAVISAASIGVLSAATVSAAAAPAVSPLAQGGALGVLAWLAWYQTTKTIPHLTAVFREELAAERKANASMVEKITERWEKALERWEQAEQRQRAITTTN